MASSAMACTCERKTESADRFPGNTLRSLAIHQSHRASRNAWAWTPTTSYWPTAIRDAGSGREGAVQGYQIPWPYSQTQFLKNFSSLSAPPNIVDKLRMAISTVYEVIQHLLMPQNSTWCIHAPRNGYRSHISWRDLGRRDLPQPHPPAFASTLFVYMFGPYHGPLTPIE